MVLACNFDLDNAAVVTALKGANILQHELRPADASSIMHEAANQGILETRLDDWGELARRCAAAV